MTGKPFEEWGFRRQWRQRESRTSQPKRAALATMIEAAASEAFVASGDKEKAERVSRNERPSAATIEAADAARRREPPTFGKQSFETRTV